MTKEEMILDPNSNLNRAEPEDHIFVISTSDITFVDSVFFWAIQRIRSRQNKPTDPEIIDALNMCSNILGITREDYCRIYDMPSGKSNG